MRYLATILLAIIGIGCQPAFATDEEDQDQSACPIVLSTLEENMENRVVRTHSAGNAGVTNPQFDETELHISLEHVIPAEWTCVTWSVKLLTLSAEVAVEGASEHTALSRTATAQFSVEFVNQYTEATVGPKTVLHHSDFFEFVTVFEVTVSNGTPIVIDGVTDSSGRWYFPATVRYQFR